MASRATGLTDNPLPQSVPITAPGCQGFVASHAAAALTPLFAALQAAAFAGVPLPAAGALRVVKQSTVRTVLSGDVGGQHVHLKLFRAATLSDRARDRLRGDRGTREARNLLAAAAL